MEQTLSAEDREQIIQTTAEMLVKHYAYTVIAEKMSLRLKQGLDDQEYGDCKKQSDLGQRLTNDLREISQDLHLLVFYAPDEAAKITKQEQDQQGYPDYESQWWEGVQSDNYGIIKLEYLAGNVGYIDLRYFAPVNLAGEVAVTAMNLISRCDALIFDLRQCEGGDPYMVQLFESYLFSENKEPKLLLNKHQTSQEKLRQIWTFPYVPGKRMPDLPVFILTSRRTFSGGEDMAYTLKHHGRATIVGETTGGGAHPIKMVPLDHGFVIALPNEYPYHPVTGSNWEGIGVAPDVKVPRQQALLTAHILALETLLETCQSEDQTLRLQWYIQRVQATYQPYPVERSVLENYVGEYRDYEVKLKEEGLVLSRKGREDDWPMIPITETLFTADQDYNARFEVNDEHQATALVWLGRDSKKEIPYTRSR